jgi:hypothetical protein
MRHQLTFCACPWNTAALSAHADTPRIMISYDLPPRMGIHSMNAAPLVF